MRMITTAAPPPAAPAMTATLVELCDGEDVGLAAEGSGKKPVVPGNVSVDPDGKGIEVGGPAAKAPWPVNTTVGVG